MAELLLARHAKALANLRDFAAFGNKESPVEPKKGFGQAVALRGIFQNRYRIVPAEYTGLVGASTYTRARQTAEIVGFTNIFEDPLLDETDFDRGGLSPEGVVLKHVRGRWVPPEAAERAARIIEKLRNGELPYSIAFSHGILVASVKLRLVDEAVAAGLEAPYEFVKGHGYIPDFGTETRITV